MCGSDAMDVEREAPEVSLRPPVFLSPTLFDLV